MLAAIVTHMMIIFQFQQYEDNQTTSQVEHQLQNLSALQ